MSEAREGLGYAAGGDAAAAALKGIFGEARPDTVFSEPEKVGDSVVIMAAAWERAGGYGFGGGGDDNGRGLGAGGGGSAQGRPVAVIRVSPAGIEVQPLIDVTKIGVTFLLALFALRKALRS
ncbi:MAG: hypothetical protein R3258_00265 [Acidimicrobiia bacterium]|nr:hypothetical protein [Acidimicrobiia bacterium]